jgi:hypothetical protein
VVILDIALPQLNGFDAADQERFASRYKAAYLTMNIA